MTNPLTLGLIVNPWSGIGGPAGLKGSDDRALVEQALAGGAERRASGRAQRCLKQLHLTGGDMLTVLTCGGSMGEDEVRAAGFDPQVVFSCSETDSLATDTQHAARLLMEAGVDLLLFVGGDGTARDICAAVGENLPVLGIPSGVKMHSGVFAISPEGAAEVVLSMMSGDLVDLRLQEVRDIDESAFRQGVVKSRFYGEMQVPECGHFVQSTKDGGREVEELVLDDIAADLRERLEPDVYYLVGAGTTPRALMDELQLPNTLLGIDVICNEALVAADLSGQQLEALLQDFEGQVVIILSITGGQGSLIGRGNQQLTPNVLMRAGRENVWVLATKSKIKALSGRPLLMDSNDLELDKAWRGYIPVITGYHDQILYPLGTHFEDSDSAGELTQ
ncbi:ATP-NAD kinase family protein [Aestuariicella sp. G3-2]|uniref:ATP-NAD kinase family protein n=1 Tax=Pseudomaricurvus albidus TaxID=2842452 RepID=UPI001C0D4F09|nr:ATP-NAD kinase family protein [Aestuariicella albida]MBU3070809.1 ATP-NAD kinase family protein [Aestuariicella albida]